MEMDDPGTPGSLGVELNLVGALARAGHRHSGEGLLDANLGIGDRLQLKFERPYATEDGGGIEPQQGLGATKIGVKWRFIERNGLSLATYPAYQFDDAFTLNDENGDPEESEGRFFYLPVLVSKAVGHLYTVAGNYGYRRNLDSRGDTHFLGVGVGRAVSWWEGRIMGELISERDAHFHNLESAVGLGLAFLPFPKSFERLSFELPVYTSLHHTIGTTEDGASHTSLVFGMSFVLKPRR
jgi:hypothetical protein